jgi:hypothetical protein
LRRCGCGRRDALDQSRCRRLDALAREYAADELIVVTITYDHAARRRSYELVAEAMGLARRRPHAAA